MKLRIRSGLFVDLASSYRVNNASRASSSASASTSSVRKTARPRRPDIPDELRELNIAPDTTLTSTAGGAVSKSYRPPSAWAVHANGEEPHLKANPWASSYKVTESKIGEEQSDRSAIASGSQPSEAMSKSRQDTGQTSRRVQSRPETSRPGFGFKSKEAIAPEPRKQTQDEREETDSSELARNRPVKQNVHVDQTAGNKAVRSILFKTTERVDIKYGHLIYDHGKGRDERVWNNGSETSISYHTLRDACPCPKCIDPSTRQRRHTSPEAYREIEASSFGSGIPDLTQIQHENYEGEEGLRIQWAPEHSAFFPVARLRAIAIPGSVMEHRLPDRGKRHMWTAEEIVDCKHLHVQYHDLMDQSSGDEMLFNTLNQLHTYGIVVIKGVPTEKTENEDCTLREVMSMIGEIRNTFYGETWNVRNVANSKNVAYTDVNLGLHADLLYFSSPPRFQALHCLRNRVEGGSSYFVDAFGAMSDILRDNPDYRVPKIDFEYDNDGHYLHRTHPLFTGSQAGSLQRLSCAVNWSPPFQGLPGSVKRHSGWYRSLDLFQRTLDEPHREWEFTMEEGDLVLFDNRRVLHARRAFRDLTEAERAERGVEVVEGESSRWLKGCYLDGEVVWDKLAVLHRQLNHKVRKYNTV